VTRPWYFRRELEKKNKDGGKTQKEKLFNLGYAKSRAPNWMGIK